MDDLFLTVEEDPSRVARAAITQGLEQFNTAQAGPDNWTPLWIIGRDVKGQVMAGLKAATFWQWLFIDHLWVADSFRGQGYGVTLLIQAEELARERGCIGAFVDTFSFQAPEFYKNNGYKEFGRLDNFPPGHTRIWLSKQPL